MNSGNIVLKHTEMYRNIFNIQMGNWEKYVFYFLLFLFEYRKHVHDHPILYLKSALLYLTLAWTCETPVVCFTSLCLLSCSLK